MNRTAATGTVYVLVDPRDQEARYVGQTTQPLAKRLSGHYGTRVPRLRSWITELRDADLKPLIIPVRENVPEADLLAAERAEITRILLAGGSLINEASTAEGRELGRQRDEREREAAERCGWRELAAAAMDVLGGPVPPGSLPDLAIPPGAWQFWSNVMPGYSEREDALGSDYGTSRRVIRYREEATRELWWYCRGIFGEVRGIASDHFGSHMEDFFTRAIQVPVPTPLAASRLLALAVWYMVSVHPWRHLADLAGLPLDDASFIAWAGAADAGVRDGLAFLSSADPAILMRLSVRWDGPRELGPGHLLAAVAAAYAGLTPAKAIKPDLSTVLSKCADDHQVTQPMADLLLRIDPRALDTAFGKDHAADVDRELSLAPGTTGRVMRALLDPGRLGHSSCRSLERAAGRATQMFPVTDLPDYATWNGYGVLGARAVAACLVRKGLAESKWHPSDEYMAHHRALWAPRPEPRDTSGPRTRA